MVQPHAGKNNDRPIRLYGVIPLKVSDPATHLVPLITAASEWKPQSRADVTVSERQGRAMNYTLARFRNHSDNPMQLPVDSYNPDAEWGPSLQDIRHRLQTNVFLPPWYGFRLAVNGLVYQSGTPYNITTGLDDNHDLVINDRPLDASGHVIGRNSGRGAARWGDLSTRLGRAFTFGVPAGGPTVARLAQQGGGPRGGGGGGGGGRAGAPPANGRFTLEFFAQAENVLNRVNFTSYAGTMTSRLFGQPTASSQARRVQIGANFRF